MISVMKNKYIYTFLNSTNTSFNKETINLLKENNFEGTYFLFLNL